LGGSNGPLVVDLRRRDVAMAEQLLDLADIRCYSRP